MTYLCYLWLYVYLLIYFIYLFFLSATLVSGFLLILPHDILISNTVPHQGVPNSGGHFLLHSPFSFLYPIFLSCYMCSVSAQHYALQLWYTLNSWIIHAKIASEAGEGRTILYGLCKLQWNVGLPVNLKWEGNEKTVWGTRYTIQCYFQISHSVWEDSLHTTPTPVRNQCKLRYKWPIRTVWLDCAEYLHPVISSSQVLCSAYLCCPLGHLPK